MIGMGAVAGARPDRDRGAPSPPMTVTVSPVNSGPLPVRAAGNAEQQQALGHAEVGGDGVGRRLGAPSVALSQQVRQPRDVHRPRQQGETGPMRLATVIACTLWVTMVGIMPQTAEIVPPVPPVVGPLVVPPAAAGPCGGVSTVPLSSRGAAPLSAAEECALKPKGGVS